MVQVVNSPDSIVDGQVAPYPEPSGALRMTIPKGRIQEKVLGLLNQIGLNFLANDRSYRPLCSDPGFTTKLLKSQNIPGLVALGRHDCGFSGYDWVTEQNAQVVELLDLGFDPVRIVAAMPEELAERGDFRSLDLGRPLVVASEYRSLASRFIAENNLNAIFVQTFGATEALPPEDADIIIDNTASGATLRQNRLVIIDEIMRSTTRFICNRAALEIAGKRRILEEMTMLMKSTLAARGRVMLEMNVSKADFDKLVVDLPCMKAPTISELFNGGGYAVKISVPSADVRALIPQLVAKGARDILEYKVDKIVLGEV
ncbi:MAG: ATP phosphoribosyltransferase [Candidatus Obscuribacter sp.]|nr:ATP phosphoribosyltransferase [Candidatus Obscuribacter sp.]MBK9278127.1 ATP phosphoribosyltransferase [Candidatus Obscuribacter sp.]